MKKPEARSDVHPLRCFHSWQVWPGSYDNPHSCDSPLPDKPRPRLDKRTPIVGIGSCFIREMKQRLESAGFNFIQGEPENPIARHASAAWERLYNLFSLRQVLEYSLRDKLPSPRWWISPQTHMVQDPYRRIVLYDDLEQAENDFAMHRQRAREALLRARALIVSLDYIEIWEDSQNGAVICLPSGPYVIEGGDLSRYRCRASSLEENLQALEDIRALMARANPECLLILALSPIQQWVTFNEQSDVFSASFQAKALLRHAAEVFTALHPEVEYFPAYEIAMLQAPALGLPIFAAGRENFHVCSEILDLIAREFDRHYCQEPEFRVP